MHVMFMAQCYAPEDVSAAVLITELATDLVERGHQVTFITGAPSYPNGRVFPGYRNALYQCEWRDGVRVVRTWSYISPRKAFWPRVWHYGTYSATALYGGLFSGRPDIVVSYSPPLPLGVTAWLLSRLWGVPWVLQLEDLYPDAAVAAGMLQNRAAIRAFSAMERFLYRRATHISLIAESFRRNLASKGVPDSRMTLIPVWADPDIVRPMPKEGPFRATYGLAGQFVVLYAGNIGITSCLEDVLEAATLLRDEVGIQFVLVGEGAKKEALQGIARERGLRNTQFLPYQPREAFPEMMAAADLSLVTLNRSSALTSLPSKIYNCMASGRPILAVAPPESEIAQLVRDGECGLEVPPGEPAALAATILRARDQAADLDRWGQNGRAMLETRFSRTHCVEQYERMLLLLLSTTQT